MKKFNRGSLVILALIITSGVASRASLRPWDESDSHVAQRLVASLTRQNASETPNTIRTNIGLFFDALSTWISYWAPYNNIFPVSRLDPSTTESSSRRRTQDRRIIADWRDSCFSSVPTFPHDGFAVGYGYDVGREGYPPERFDGSFYGPSDTARPPVPSARVLDVSLSSNYQSSSGHGSEEPAPEGRRTDWSNRLWSHQMGTGLGQQRRSSIVDQEALTHQRGSIYAGYKALLDSPAGPQLKAFLNMPGAYGKALDEVEEILKLAIFQEGLPEKEYFRRQTALEGLAYLKSIDPHFKVWNHLSFRPEDLPTLGALVGLLHQLLVQEADAFTRDWIVKSFQTMREAFPSMDSYNSPAEFLCSQESGSLVSALAHFIRTGEGVFPSALNHGQRKILKEMARGYLGRGELQRSRLDLLNPFVEALFMAKRGHSNVLDRASVAHHQACADGVYLNFMRALGELPALGIYADALHRVEVLSCAAPEGAESPL